MSLQTERWLCGGGRTPPPVSSSFVASVQRFEHPSERSLLRHSAEQYGVSHRRQVTLSSGGRGPRQNAQWGGVATKSILIDVVASAACDDVVVSAAYDDVLRLAAYDVAASASGESQ